jgi:hypothetical protein
MPIVFACPRCKFVMKAPEDQGGIMIKCLQCNISLEIPHLRGVLVDVPADQATPVVFGVTVPKWGSSGHGKPAPAPVAVKDSRADEWLKEAVQRKDADDLEGAIKLLVRAYEEIKRANALYPVETYLRLPLYLQQAGRSRESWQEFNKVLFHGYSNQPKDPVGLAQDRAKVLEKMQLFLDRDRKSEVGSVYKVFSQVLEAVGFYRDDKKREARTRLNRTTCQELVAALRKYTGNLGPLEEMRTIIIEELTAWPELEFDRLGNRLEAAFAAQSKAV